MSEPTITPRRAMARALVLARRGMGTAHPNPPVGAVLVKDGAVVGEGYHAAAGRPHAERIALEQARERARGAVLFTTLEPCRHFGRTPPCVDAILEAGVAKVHVAVSDPNPLSGAGARALAEAGVEVVFGPGRREAAHLTAGFASRIARGRPRFLLKMAASLDGRIATPGGDSRWISSPTARSWVHRRRREADAILVGAGTAVRDNPALTTRHVSGRSPDRIVVDSMLRVPASARVFADNGPRRIVAATARAGAEARAALEAGGVEVWELPADPRGRVALPALAARLGDEGYDTVLAEGGGTLAGALFEERLVDQAWVVLSRSLLLGGGGPGWAEGLRVDRVARAPRVRRTALRPLGEDWLLTLVPEAAQWWDPETLGAPDHAAIGAAAGEAGRV